LHMLKRGGKGPNRWRTQISNRETVVGRLNVQRPDNQVILGQVERALRYIGKIVQVCERPCDVSISNVRRPGGDEIVNIKEPCAILVTGTRNAASAAAELERRAP